MSQRSEVKVLCPARWGRRIREAQGRHCEVGSEGSVERMRGARNTNLIRGVTVLGPVGTQPPSPLSTEGMFGQSSVSAQTVLRLTPGELLSALGRGGPRQVAEGDRSLPNPSAAVSRRHSTDAWRREGPNGSKGKFLQPVGPHARRGSKSDHRRFVHYGYILCSLHPTLKRRAHRMKPGKPGSQGASVPFVC